MMTHRAGRCLVNGAKIFYRGEDWGNSATQFEERALTLYWLLLRSLWLLRLQSASFVDRVQVNSRRRKLGNFRPTRSLKFDTEQTCAKHFARGPLVHSEEVPPNPIPIVAVVLVIDAHQDMHLRLSPETWPIWPRQSRARVEIRQLQLAVAAIKDDSGLIVTLRSVVRRQFKAGSMGRGHAIFRAVLRPAPAGA